LEQIASVKRKAARIVRAATSDPERNHSPSETPIITMRGLQKKGDAFMGTLDQFDEAQWQIQDHNQCVNGNSDDDWISRDSSESEWIPTGGELQDASKVQGQRRTQM